MNGLRHRMNMMLHFCLALATTTEIISGAEQDTIDHKLWYTCIVCAQLRLECGNASLMCDSASLV